MNWDALGVLAETVGAVAVVVTLIYLAVEVRNNRSATESASIDSLAAGFNLLNTQIMDNPDLAEIFLRGTANHEDLDDVQKLRFIAMVQSYVNHFTTVKKYYDAGILSEEQWLAHSVGVSRLTNSPGGIWACRNITITPGVAAEFERLRDIEASDGYWGLKQIG